MARAPVRPGFTPGGSGGRPSGRRFAYFRGVWDELRKVIWPTREELWRMTGVVVVTVILFSLLIGGTDFVLGYAVKPIYNNQSTTAGNSTGGSTTITPTSTPSAGASASASTSASAAASASASASASPTT